MENNNTPRPERLRFTFPTYRHAQRAVALFDAMGIPCGMPSLRAENPMLPASKTVLVDVRDNTQRGTAVDCGFQIGCYGYATVDTRPHAR